MRSNLPAAEKFEDWVVNDVLSSVSKHGMYVKDELLDNPEFLLDTDIFPRKCIIAYKQYSVLEFPTFVHRLLC